MCRMLFLLSCLQTLRDIITRLTAEYANEKMNSLSYVDYITLVSKLTIES